MTHWLKANRLTATSITVAMFAVLSYYGYANLASRKHDFCRTMTINPESLQVTLSDPIPFDPGEPNGPYFWPFTFQSGYYVSHYDGKSAYPHRVRYNVFTVNQNNQLEEREKYQELVRGPFGTIYAHTNAIYELEALDGEIEFGVLHYSNEAEHEPPLIISAPPSSSPHKLDAISLIRIFRYAQKYTVVIGNYTPDGKLISSIKPTDTEAGDWNGGTIDFEHGYNLYGFPAQIPVDEYLKKPHAVWKVIALPSILNIINFHYERNKWVRQDSFVSNGAPKTRFLTYVTTAQDTMLAPVDQKMQYKVVGY